MKSIIIIYEDDGLLVIDKPSGIITHPKNPNDRTPSVVGWLIEKYPEIKKVGFDPIRPGIVHRLDQATSGLLVIAKTPTAFDYLKKLFAERKIQKIYLALVAGQLKNLSGVIKTPLGKIGIRQTTRIHGRKILEARDTITEYRVLKVYKAGQFFYSLLEVSPKTGRTHQIRVHLKSIGHPIVCDPLYKSGPSKCPVGLDRIFLHAQKLSFTSPSGQALVFELDLPLDLKKFLDSLPNT